MWNAVLERIRFWRSADRLGPDIPWTHWRLYWPGLMRRLAQKKFYAFGEGAEFRPGAYAICCSKISLGKQVVIRPGSMLFADPRVDGLCITIEDHAMLGSGVHIYVGNHEFSDPACPVMFQGHRPCVPVVLRAGCWVGAGSIILPGVIIGNNAVVGAGSVVTHSIPDGCVAAGSPARIIKSATEREETIRHA